MADTDLNRLLAKHSVNHQILCIEGPNGLWSVECQVCMEQRPGHLNFGGKLTWQAPYGEEMATRIALDHLSTLGYVPQRLASITEGKGRNRYE